MNFYNIFKLKRSHKRLKLANSILIDQVANFNVEINELSNKYCERVFELNLEIGVLKKQLDSFLPEYDMDAINEEIEDMTRGDK